jgi:hypothetical protein
MLLYSKAREETATVELRRCAPLKQGHLVLRVLF